MKVYILQEHSTPGELFKKFTIVGVYKTEALANDEVKKRRETFEKESPEYWERPVYTVSPWDVSQ